MDPLEALGFSLGQSATSSADANVSAALVNNAEINIGDTGTDTGGTSLDGIANPSTSTTQTATATPTTTVSPTQGTGTASSAAAANLSTEAIMWLSAAGIAVALLLAIGQAHK